MESIEELTRKRNNHFYSLNRIRFKRNNLFYSTKPEIVVFNKHVKPLVDGGYSDAPFITELGNSTATNRKLPKQKKDKPQRIRAIWNKVVRNEGMGFTTVTLNPRNNNRNLCSMTTTECNHSPLIRRIIRIEIGCTTNGTRLV